MAGNIATRPARRRSITATADTVPQEAVLRLIEAKNAERDAAYQDGYSRGYVAGLEAGLRTVLADAATAFGSAA